MTDIRGASSPGVAPSRCVVEYDKPRLQVLQQPLPDVNALPCNDDLLVWHGNGEPKIDTTVAKCDLATALQYRTF